MARTFNPLVKTIPYDSPLNVFKKVYQVPPAFLLESSRAGGMTGRFSFIGMDPYMCFRFDGVQGEIVHKGGAFEAAGPDPISSLQRLLADFRMPRGPGLPPFFGGAVGFFGYDIARFFEKLPHREKPKEPFPEIVLHFVETIIAFDHFQRRADIIYHPSPEALNMTEWGTLEKKGKENLDRYLDKLNVPLSPDTYESICFSNKPMGLESSLTQEGFEKLVLQCQEYIKRGDIFQANLSQRFSFAKPDLHPLALYERLQRINPSPFSSFFDGGDFQIVSSSPERLVNLSQGILSTRPIAGTRPRGLGQTDDLKIASDLIENEKERAEHLMMIDLERNDLGKVSQYGSIRVDEFMKIENYSHVIHIVSNIVSKIKLACDWYDVLKALFPGGTITGVPKIRSMEIIDELEPVKRGPYTGSLGYISFSGELDLNILIRSLFMNENVGFIQTGAGIVADSVPAKEYEETIHKAEALVRALQGNP
jgi:anthranilate/para-aminobenzoate synthase component I